MGKKFLILILFGVSLISCTAKINRELLEFVSKQEHDPNLFGWWRPADSTNSYEHYDGKSFRITDAYMGQDGKFKHYRSVKLWYTLNGKLFYIREATPLTGAFEGSIEYKFSEDGDTLFTRSLSSDIWSVDSYRMK